MKTIILVCDSSESAWCEFHPAHLANHFHSMLFVLLCLISILRAQNLYFDRTLPDEETWLTPTDLHRARLLNGRDVRLINDSAMYNANRFEGDISSYFFCHSFSATYFSYIGPFILYFSKNQSQLPEGRLVCRSKIAEAIEEYRKKTCIDFSPKSAADQDYIHIVPDDGCYSLVGRIGGKQPVSLGDGCIQKGIIIHELMHAVGFFHEQSRADRDDHVVINWNNVESGLQGLQSLILSNTLLRNVLVADQFDKYSLSMVNHLETEYDYGSVMHYAPTAFSKNGKPTIEPRKKGVEIGQRLGFSDLDLYKINKLYNCPQSETTSSTLQKTMVGTKSGVESSSLKSTEDPSNSENSQETTSSAATTGSELLLLLTKTCSDRTAGYCQQTLRMRSFYQGLANFWLRLANEEQSQVQGDRMTKFKNFTCRLY
ncbi:astacin [Teladorsagia circumcincta]|uniref:Metalloendopeptidase n=1 Tax=Teladorsagia circumcincta TaxID=45464 RepID=A0A2G9V0N0_TELCI|nr:astacin [Teladorsagia circumcincta]